MQSPVSKKDEAHKVAGSDSKPDESKKDDSLLDSAVNDLVSKAVLKGLSHFGSGHVVESLVYMLELEYSADLLSIAKNPSLLRRALSSMFGSAGYVVEEKVREELARQIGVDQDGKSLEQLIDQARQSRFPESRLQKK